jgi:hypothetical protein
VVYPIRAHLLEIALIGPRLVCYIRNRLLPGLLIGHLLFPLDIAFREDLW